MAPGSLAIIWPHLATLGLLAALGWYSWRQGSVPGARFFAVSCLLAALWLAGAAAELLAADVSARIAWLKFQVMCQLPLATANTCFALDYVYPGRWLTRRRLTLLAMPPIAVVALVLTNDLHHWVWRGFVYDGFLQPLRGPANWIAMGYGMALVLVNLAAFAWLFVRSPQHRWPVVLMMVGQVASRTLYMLNLFPQRTVFGWNPLMLGFVITFGAYAIALFGFRMLDPLPVAHRTAVEQMRDGMLVLDTRWRAISLNPAAQRILGLPAAAARGMAWAELLPACPDAGWCLDPGATPTEIELGTGAEVRRYALIPSRLHDYRGLTTGHLLLLHDVTEQRRAQAQLLEQHRALAMLQERERLARELHDSLGQVLSYASFQVETAAKLSRAGQGVAAAEQLDRLGAVVRGAHADLREVILNLRSTVSQQQPFFAVVKQYLDAFTSSYDIQTHLSVDPGLEESYATEAQLQLIRVLQEALSNARKHGGVHQVHVTFARGDGRLRMSVHDDGRGFDPDRVSEPGGPHFGLQFMRERALEMGGSLQIHSAPGAGTRVVLEIPEADHV